MVIEIKTEPEEPIDGKSFELIVKVKNEYLKGRCILSNLLR